MSTQYFRFKSIQRWDGERRSRFDRGRFSVSFTTILKELQSELSKIGATDCVVCMDLKEEDIRYDGFPRANAKPEYPGVQVFFNSKHGPLRYQCDKYADWQHNVRAISLTLESLRTVDRYDCVSKGEQYSGFKALPEYSSEGFTGVHEAEQWIRKAAVVHDAGPAGSLKDIVRSLKKVFHPDAGGDANKFKQLMNAANLVGA